MSRPNVLLRLYSADETACWPLDGFDGLTVEHGRFGTATCSVTVPVTSKAGTLAKDAAVGVELWGYQLWVTEGTATVFRGPVLEVGLRTDGSRSVVDITAENHLQHCLRRRLIFSSDLATIDQTAAPNATALDLIDDAMGGVVGPVEPTGYPVGVDRTEWGFSTTYAAGSSDGAPASVQWESQNGKNLQDALEELCVRYDMCLVQKRASTAAYSVDVEYPYQETDRTAYLQLSGYRASLSDFQWTVPYSLTTVARSAGSGTGTTQTDTFSATGTATYGVHEDQSTTPAGSANACSEDAALMLRAAEPLIVVECTPRQTSGARFTPGTPAVGQYTWRDLVRVYDTTFERFADQVVVAWKLDAWAGGRGHRYTLVLNEPRIALTRLMAGKTGMPFGRSAGDRWRTTAG